jgi:hypothetical protein
VAGRCTRILLAAAAAMMVIVFSATAAQASTLTIYRNDFEQGLAGSPAVSPAWGSSSTVNATTWGISEKAAHSGTRSLWCAADAWSSPVFTSGDFDESKALRIRVTYAGAGSGGSTGDVDAAVSQGATGLTRLEAESADSAVVRSGAWAESSAPGFSGGKTMTTSSGSRPSITFTFAGDSDASQTTRKLVVLAGRIDGSRGVVSIDLWTGSGADPSSSSWYQVMSAAQFDESLISGYPPSEAGYVRFPLDLRGLRSASVSLAAFVRAGGMPYFDSLGYHTDSAGATWSIIDQDTGAIYRYRAGIEPALPGSWDTISEVLPGGAVGHRVWLELFFWSDPRSSRSGIFIDDLNVTGQTYSAPDVPALSSSTDPDQDAWLSVDTPSVSWTTNDPAVSGYSWAIDHSPFATPPTSGPQVVGAGVKSVTLDAATLGSVGLPSPLPDGEWFVHVAAQRPPLRPDDTNWSSPGNYRLRIDRHAPTVDSVAMDLARTDSASILGATVRASDSGSGVASFKYAIGTSPGATNARGWTSVSASPHIVAKGLALKRGSRYYMTVRASDYAGHTGASRSSLAAYVRLATSVTLAVSPSTLAYGLRTRASGAISTRQKGVTVQLWRAGSLVPVVSARTNALGRYSMSFKPLENGVYWVKRLPDAVRAGSQSAKRRVAVAFRVSAVWRKLGPGAGAVSGSVVPGGSRLAYVQRRSGSVWRNVRSFFTDTAGGFSLMTFPGKVGKSDMRVMVPGEAKYAAGTSRPARLVFP